MQGIQNVLLVAYLLIVLALIAVILLQRSEGGGLGIGGNAGGLMTVRGSANLLTRTTAVLAALFFAAAIALTILSSIDHGANDILSNAATAPASAPAAVPGAAPSSAPAGTVLEQLTQLQNEAASSAPAAGDQGLALPLDMAQPQTSAPASQSTEAAPATTTPAETPASSAPLDSGSAPSAPAQ